MFCTKCGSQIPDNSIFCTKCGNEVGKRAYIDQQTEEAADNIQSSAPDEERKRKGGKKGTIIFLSFLFVILAAGCVFLAMHVDAKKNYENQLALGDKYLNDLEYEAAIAAYKAAIEIDPSMEAAYLGLAEAYLGTGEKELAVQALEDGYDRTGSERIKDKMADFLEESTETSEREEAVQENNSMPAEGQKAANITVRQVDNSMFPEITFYASITDPEGKTIPNLKEEDFQITEIDGQGNMRDVQLSDVHQVINSARVSLNLVLDISSSMNGSNKIIQAKNAALSFLNQVNFDRGDAIEVITFDDFVYLAQEFTSDYQVLSDVINNISLGGNTAIYDAIYAGLIQTYYEGGAKCVIAFTDGEENASSYTYDDVVGMAQSTGIPVFIIGIGNSYGYSEFQSLAEQCSGNFYSANESNLETILEDVYLQIYQEQQDYYVFKYKSPDDTNRGVRDISLTTSKDAPISGQYRKEYIPVTDLNGGFSSSYADQDYIITDSSQRQVTIADLEGMSLAQLRIARNEIFARHGRQFKDVMLNKWFYSKTWYLDIAEKFSPSAFDTQSPSPLSGLENENTEFIRTYEEQITASQDIFPDASNTLLSEYDLCLSKAVLKKALEQVQGYRYNDILRQNIALIEDAIERDEVIY